MSADFLDKIIGRSTSHDLAAIRDDMMLRALHSYLGATNLHARIFSNTDEVFAAENQQPELEGAAVAFMDSLEKLALVLYIQATSNTEVAAVEQEAEKSLNIAMEEWLKHCNPHVVASDKKERDWLMNQENLPQIVESISKAMCDQLQECGIKKGDTPQKASGALGRP